MDQRDGGTSFLSLVALLFIALKLTDVIDWSWWWVLAPIWMPAVVGILFVLGIMAAIVVKALKDD